jgi:L-ribulokinase
MQTYADVTRRSLSVIKSDQGPALGSALHAAVAAGHYPDVPSAAGAMGGKLEAAYLPDPASADVYDRLYAEYLLLHDYFGRGGNDVMHRLRGVRDRALAGVAAGRVLAGSAQDPPGPDAPPATVAVGDQDGELS